MTIALELASKVTLESGIQGKYAGGDGVSV